MWEQAEHLLQIFPTDVLSCKNNEKLNNPQENGNMGGNNLFRIRFNLSPNILSFTRNERMDEEKRIIFSPREKSEKLIFYRLEIRKFLTRYVLL